MASWPSRRARALASSLGCLAASESSSSKARFLIRVSIDSVRAPSTRWNWTRRVSIQPGSGLASALPPSGVCGGLCSSLLGVASAEVSPPAARASPSRANSRSIAQPRMRRRAAQPRQDRKPEPMVSTTPSTSRTLMTMS